MGLKRDQNYNVTYNQIKKLPRSNPRPMSTGDAMSKPNMKSIPVKSLYDNKTISASPM